MITFLDASKSKFPAQHSSSLTYEIDENLERLDGNTYKVWACLNRLLDSRAVNAIGQYLGFTVRVSQANIAKRVNLSIATVKRCLGRMESKGIVQVERPTFGCNRYRIVGYTQPTETNPVAPPVETIERYEQAERKQRPNPMTSTQGDSITGELSIAQSCEPPIAQNCEPPNRPVLTDKSTILSPVTVPDKEEVVRGKTNERERDFASLFYEEAMGKPNAIIDGQKRRRINRQCGQLVKDIASRVGIDHAQGVLIDAFKRVRGYDPYSFGIMSADYGERAIEAAIAAHLAARDAENVTTLTHTASNESETCDTSDEPQTNAHTSNVKHSIRNPQSAIRNPLSVEERIRYHLAAVKYRDIDHAVLLLQRRDNTLSRDDIIRVLEAVDTERASKVPLLRRLSPHAVIDSVGRSVSEAADVMGALAHLRGMRQAEAMGG